MICGQVVVDDLRFLIVDEKPHLTFLVSSLNPANAGIILQLYRVGIRSMYISVQLMPTQWVHYNVDRDCASLHELNNLFNLVREHLPLSKSPMIRGKLR